MAPNTEISGSEALQTPLLDLGVQPLNQKTRQIILKQFWNLPSDLNQQSDQTANAYIEFAVKQCRLLPLVRGWLGNGPNLQRPDVSALKLRHIISIAQMIKVGSSLSEIESFLLSEVPNQMRDLSRDVIDLTTQLQLMVPTKAYPHGFRVGEGYLQWDKESISNAFKVHFQMNPSNVLEGEMVNLDEAFTARNLKRIGGFTIEWTDNLLNHLRVSGSGRSDFKSVAIFHHASFLRHQLQSSMYPEGFIKETMKTLSLLFPTHQRDTEAWLLEKQAKLDCLTLDQEVGQCGIPTRHEREIDNFHFWHDRLVILKQIFDETKPQTLAQVWKDRRNPSQWYSIWVAGLLFFGTTVIIGMIQIILACLQVYVAYHPRPT